MIRDLIFFLLGAILTVIAGTFLAKAEVRSPIVFSIHEAKPLIQQTQTAKKITLKPSVTPSVTPIEHEFGPVAREYIKELWKDDPKNQEIAYALIKTISDNKCDYVSEEKTEYGLFGISVNHQEDFGDNSMNDCYSNMTIAKKIWDEFGWEGWEEYKDGSYKKYLVQPSKSGMITPSESIARITPTLVPAKDLATSVASSGATKTATDSAPQQFVKNTWSGAASYYSRAGCVGCSANFTMANGQPLVDSAFTVAFNYAPLGSTVRVTNLANDKSVNATVTDTGGFNKLGRIIDLTIGTRDAIACSTLCQVRVDLLS